jgi:hypothetical protein
MSSTTPEPLAEGLASSSATASTHSEPFPSVTLRWRQWTLTLASDDTGFVQRQCLQWIQAAPGGRLSPSLTSTPKATERLLSPSLASQTVENDNHPSPVSEVLKPAASPEETLRESSPVLMTPEVTVPEASPDAEVFSGEESVAESVPELMQTTLPLTSLSQPEPEALPAAFKNTLLDELFPSSQSFEAVTRSEPVEPALSAAERTAEALLSALEPSPSMTSAVDPEAGVLPPNASVESPPQEPVATDVETFESRDLPEESLSSLEASAAKETRVTEEEEEPSMGSFSAPPPPDETSLLETEPETPIAISVPIPVARASVPAALNDLADPSETPESETVTNLEETPSSSLARNPVEALSVTEPQDQDAFKAVLDSIFEDLKEEPEPAIPEPEAYEDSEAELTASDSLEIHEASDEISIANFQELLTLANQPTTSQSVLILAGLYLTDVEETPRFTLSQLNRLTQEAGSAPMTHGDLQSAIEQEQLTLVADTHDTLDETHYMLTELGHTAAVTLCEEALATA